jgi:Flp pilus assembly protein TadG
MNSGPVLRLFRAVLASDRAVSAVETALVAPFLAVTIMGTVDVARYAAARIELQQAVNRGLEMSMMGGTTYSSTSIQSEAATQANVATSAVTITQSLTCAGTATTWSLSCTSTQETARYTSITVTKDFTPSFALGSLARMYGNSSGVIALSQTGVVRIQ